MTGVRSAAPDGHLSAADPVDERSPQRSAVRKVKHHRLAVLNNPPVGSISDNQMAGHAKEQNDDCRKAGARSRSETGPRAVRENSPNALENHVRGTIRGVKTGCHDFFGMGGITH